MKPVSYFDFTTLEGLESYREKAHSNVALFDQILGTRAEVIGQMLAFETQGRNHELLKEIKRLTGLSEATLRGINVADEIMNLNSINLFGCTSVSQGTQIGQTLDLFTLELSVIREPDALYVTMPPYLALMGMGKNLAFVTNFLSGPVRANGTPISHMRRELLRRTSVQDAIAYLRSIDRSNTVNFLLADEKEVLDVETTPDSILIHEPKTTLAGRAIAHTNHFVKPNIHDDKNCPRLSKANQLLNVGLDLKTIFDDSAINLPVSPINERYGFGSIIHLIMDVKTKTFRYRDPSMSDYKELTL